MGEAGKVGRLQEILGELVQPHVQRLPQRAAVLVRAVPARHLAQLVVPEQNIRFLNANKSFDPVLIFFFFMKDNNFIDRIMLIQLASSSILHAPCRREMQKIVNI